MSRRGYPEPEDSYSLRLGNLYNTMDYLTPSDDTTFLSFPDDLMYRRTLLDYFKYRRSECLAEINSYFVAHFNIHNGQTQRYILRNFHIFLELANEYEALIPGLIASEERLTAIKETVLVYVADLINKTNEIIDMIERGVPAHDLV